MDSNQTPRLAGLSVWFSLLSAVSWLAGDPGERCHEVVALFPISPYFAGARPVPGLLRPPRGKYTATWKADGITPRNCSTSRGSGNVFCLQGGFVLWLLGKGIKSLVRSVGWTRQVGPEAISIQNLARFWASELVACPLGPSYTTKEGCPPCSFPCFVEGWFTLRCTASPSRIKR